MNNVVMKPFKKKKHDFMQVSCRFHLPEIFGDLFDDQHTDPIRTGSAGSLAQLRLCQAAQCFVHPFGHILSETRTATGFEMTSYTLWHFFKKNR